MSVRYNRANTRVRPYSTLRIKGKVSLVESLTLLNSKLGTADTIRFLNQFTTGFGDCTEEVSLPVKISEEQPLTGKVREAGPPQR